MNPVRGLLEMMEYPIAAPVTASTIILMTLGSSLWSSMNYFQEFTSNPNPFSANQDYDFIVVGGGSTGSVIASRLSESGQFRVLLLEAGGDPGLLNSIPQLATYNLHRPAADWQYRIVPQINTCHTSEERRMVWPRGKALGGSSVLNFMIYARGSPKDFDEWAKLTDDPQWSYQNVLPFFKKSQDYQGNYPSEKYHGTGGLLRVSKQSYMPTIKYWLEAAEEMGFPSNFDLNGYQVPGFGPEDVTIRRGSRESTYHAFLKPFLDRVNLQIYRFAHVTKINLDASNRATGVTYVRGGRTFTANAGKEVILSAGAIGSPQLLMLSGIGPVDHLKSVGIKPLVDLPGVGQNLQDHVLTMFGPVFINSSLSFNKDRDLSLARAFEYVQNGTGPFSSNDIAGLGFISTSKADPTWANLEFHHTPIGISDDAGELFTELFGLKPDMLANYYKPYLGRDANFVLMDLGRPDSFGEIKLETSDPFTHPLIDPNYYSNYSDMEAMIEGMEFLTKFYEETNAWQKVGAKLIAEPLPGCEAFAIKSKDYYECYLRHMTLTIFHPCCTAKMGRSDDRSAVVDSSLRVFGVSGLRVGDASIMPVITNANLNAPCIMIGEKASSLILSAWK